MPSFIRFFAENDYQAMQNIHRALDPTSSIAVEDMCRRDLQNDSRCRFQRWCVEQDGNIIAFGEYSQDAYHYHPKVFTLDGLVHPLYQRQGIGGALYEQVTQALTPFGPFWFKKRIQEDNSSGSYFLKKRGFQEERRLWESRLNLTTFHVTPYEDYELSLQKQGIIIRSFREILDDPSRDRKLYQLNNELEQDVLAAGPRTTLTYNEYVQYKLNTPTLLLDGCFVAIHQEDNSYIGMSQLRTIGRQKELASGLTAIKRTYRRRGIAQALKLKCLSYARQFEYTVVWTNNDIRSTSMLKLNEQLGFVKQRLWIELMRTFP